MRRLTRRQRIAFTVLALIALAFISLDVAGGRLRAVHGGVAGAFGALYRGTDTVLGPARQYVAGLPHAGSAQRTIDKLQAQNAQLKGQLAAGRADQNIQNQLASLQLAADRAGYRILPARVTALGPGGTFDWTLTLDVGSSSGVEVDQTVTDGNALVGRVLKVNGGTCTVLLAADPDSGVGVRDVRSGQLAIVTGRGGDGFTAVPLDSKADVKDGDELRTGPAGASGYVPDLAVGTITAVRTSGDGSTRASVKPAVSPTGLDLVGVILAGGTEGPRAALTPTSTPPSADAPPGPTSTPLAAPPR